MNLCKEDFIALQSSQVKHTPQDSINEILFES